MIYFNDASLHGQFPAFVPFQNSLKNLWGIRKTLLGRGIQLRVCRTLRSRQITATETFNDLLGAFPRDIRNRLLVWIDKEGPFWDEERHHSEGEYFECNRDVVTDTGAAEAAYLQSEGIEAWLFSIDPSMFLSDPLAVAWLGREGGDLILDVPNGWNLAHAERCTTAFERPFSNWEELLEWAERECSNLILSPEIQTQLSTQFFPNVAQRSKVLLRVLDQIVGFLKAGKVQEFQDMRTEWMQGDRARFSPSSESDLNDFAAKLTFLHPESGRRVLCSWHGKIQTPQFRIHYEWPLHEGEKRLFVAYIGPKITKR
jgi:hypothetical protein